MMTRDLAEGALKEKAVVRRYLVSPARRDVYKAARNRLGLAGTASKGWLFYLSRLSLETTLVWQGETLEDTTRWMYDEWQRLIKDDAITNPCTLMTLACCRAFGLARSDLLCPALGDAVVRVPRFLAVKMLHHAKHKRPQIGLAFNRSPNSIRMMSRLKRYTEHLEFLNVVQTIDNGGPAPVGQPEGSVPDGVHGRAGGDSEAPQA